MAKKIYLNIKEAEDLVLKKIIDVPIERKIIDQAKGEYSVNVLYEKGDDVFEYLDHILITMGGIEKIEIPEDEERLFMHHMHVPTGLVNRVPRKYKDVENEGTLELFIDEEEEGISNLIKRFSYIRKGLLFVFGIAQGRSYGEEFTKDAFEWLRQFENISDLEKSILFEIISEGFFPMTVPPAGKFLPDALRRIAWFGHYLFVERSEFKIPEEEFNNARLWLKVLTKKEEKAEIKEALSNVPENMKPYSDFIVGYFFASSFYEECDTDEAFHFELMEYLKNYGVGNNSKLICWAIFFQSIFKSNLDFLYVIPSLRPQQSYLEKSILNLLLPKEFSKPGTLELPELSEKDALTEFFQFTKGSSIRKIEIVDTKNRKDIVKSRLSEEDLNEMIFPETPQTPFLINNTYTWANGKLVLKFHDFNTPLSRLTFIYPESEKSLAQKLKDLKIKHRQVEELFKNKKALLGFLNWQLPKKTSKSANLIKRNDFVLSPVLEAYTWLTQMSFKKFKFDRIIMVLLVDEERDTLLSVEAELLKQNMKTILDRHFGNVIILIKNLRNPSDGEIKRNLEQLLGEYKLEEIELIPDNINEEVLDWVFSISDKYIMEEEVENPYVFLST